MSLAQEEARRLRHNFLAPEHILLGIVLESESVAARALAEMGATPPLVRQMVEEIVGYGDEPPRGPVPFTPRAKAVLERWSREALALGETHISPEHMLIGLLHESESLAGQVLMKLDVDAERVHEQVARLAGRHSEDVRDADEPLPGKLGRDLTADSWMVSLDPVVGRDQEIEQVMRILTRRAKNCPVLVGEPGIDKAAVVHGFVATVTGRDAPELFRDKVVYGVDTDMLPRRTLVVFVDDLDRCADDVVVKVCEAVKRRRTRAVSSRSSGVTRGGRAASSSTTPPFVEVPTMRRAPRTRGGATASRVFSRYGAAPPVREAGADLSGDVERFERVLPPWFPELALNESLRAMLREIGGAETRRALRAQLVDRPLGTGAFPELADQDSRSFVDDR